MKAAVANTELRDAAAGEDLGRQIREQLGGEGVDAVIVFASPENDYSALLDALHSQCGPGAMVGCSSAGEFTNESRGVGMACAVAMHAPQMSFSATVGRGVGEDTAAASEAIVGGFSGVDGHEHRHRAALVLTDALAGYSEELVERLILLTGGTYRFFGGGAGDDARFERTHVFFGTEVLTGAAVALEMLSDKPIAIGVRHGWKPASPAFRVTESTGFSLASLNASPASEAFQEHAENTGQTLDTENPIPFFLHNVLGVETEGGFKLRVPLGMDPAGCVVCAAEVPAGTTAHIMGAGVDSSVAAATDAARDAIAQLDGATPGVALFFDCVATRLRMGKEFGLELDSLASELGDAKYAGFNTYGQIARVEGQFSGFHNCTAIVCIIPE